ncbi:OmpP1/FadL family transporter [Brumimicrobium oceani]|uniref:Aromatic hydrocarbon degradation protein n=1 Tax=Brumimicrobium oceani TaxID=2100725 RepID=A0A2U2XE72_9FLAO|nr:outer membrane protein transport protein [Brumimicrobium oceani]PWH86085.1 hypothetical protein DIT68_05885 [Brumimicrobium oceani]
MKKINSIGLFLAVVTFTSANLFAQNENDVLRYSNTDVFGSARFEAMAGSFGALGADFSAIQINPASMGRFSSSNLSISLNNSSLQNEALYNGTATETQQNKFTISSGGAVFTTDLSAQNKGRKFSQFTIGYTRLKNFSNSRRYEGQNLYSLLDVYANDGLGIDPEYIFTDRPFSTGLAYDVGAVYYDESNFQYYPELTPTGNMYHERSIQTDGGIGEFHIGYSENYMNRFYYGASLGIRRVNYSESYVHSENVLDTVGVSLRSFEYDYEQVTEGTGFNLKLGVLFLPTEEFRIGLAFESPTIINLNDEWTATMNATHNYGYESIQATDVPEGQFGYRIKTPMKLRGSFAYVFGMRGAINVDLEMSRLTNGRIRPSSDNSFYGNAYTFDYENEGVMLLYRTIVNTRIGMEYMVYPDFYLRGGVAILPQPYDKEFIDITSPNMTYSGGIGWDNKYLSIDLSYRLFQVQEEYYAFDPSRIENRTDFKTNMHSVVLSGRLKF